MAKKPTAPISAVRAAQRTNQGPDTNKAKPAPKAKATPEPKEEK